MSPFSTRTEAVQRIRPGIELPVSEIADHLLDFTALFPGLSRIECEVGFCSAIFLTEYANRHPEAGIVGIEKKHAYFLRGLHNLERKLKQDNVKTIEFDARPLIEMLIPAGSLDILHIYFPDPWPKKRHIFKRMINRENLKMFHEKLKPGGRLSAATDHPGYAEFIEAELPFVADLYTRLPYGRTDREVMTKWERKQTEKGIPINYFLLEKR
jgi:tRNA (guanine-N7-)-methyltransferase